jgi:L-fuconolactonase
MSNDLRSAAVPARTDAHQHFWRRARGDYDWLDDADAALAPLLRDFLPDDLAPLLARHGIGRTVLVQAAPTVAETEFLLDVAERHDVVGAVVGWVDLAHAQGARALERLAARPALRGVRPMLQDLPDAQWIATAPRPANVEAMVALGLRFDALVRPGQLDALLRFAREWPALPVVIDHAAKPPLHLAWNSPELVAWRERMAALAALPQVCCKVSGLVTELPRAATSSATTIAIALGPVLDVLLEQFGAARLMWGSDWPVVNLASCHDDWVAASELLFAPLSADERAAVWHDTARRFYGLG